MWHGPVIQHGTADVKEEDGTNLETVGVAVHDRFAEYEPDVSVDGFVTEWTDSLGIPALDRDQRSSC